VTDPGNALQVALAIDVPDREAELLRIVHDPAFTVGGRPCEVSRLCASIRDLEQVISTGSAEVAVVASQLNAIPHQNLVDLAHRRGLRLVVMAPDPADRQWDDFPGGLVIGTEPHAELLAFALAGDRASITSWRHQRQPAKNNSMTSGLPPIAATGASAATPATKRSTAKRGTVITVAGAYRPSGKSLVAAGLTCALGVPGPAVLVDADMRFGTMPFTLGVSNGQNLCQLADKYLDSDGAWDAALLAELQPMREPSQAMVLAGVPRPSMRGRVTAGFYERLVDALAERFPYVVLDTSGEGWAAADSSIDGVSLRLADRILLVIRPDIQGVALAREALREWGRRDRIGLVLNQAGLRGMESRAEIEMVLGLGVVAVIPHDSRGVDAARRRRRPIVCQSKATAAGPLLDLATRLHGGGPIVLPPDVEPASSPNWWRRVAPSGVGGALRW
jgi:MinD-like ATPase involved in chromosome partitioning or flagellar assembly